MGKEAIEYLLKRAKLKGKEKTISEWQHSTLLIISINNSHYRNKKSIIQILDWLKEKTNYYDVIVGDYLHRTNQKMYLGMNDEDAINSSLKLGDELIAFFKKTADVHGVTNYRIRRTKEFYKNIDFKKYLSTLYELYDKNEEFQISVDKVINKFLKRLNHFVVSNNEAFELSKKYLLEELVIFQILYQEDKSIIVYPGKWSVFESIINGNIGQILKNLSNYLLVELNFIKIK